MPFLKSRFTSHGLLTIALLNIAWCSFPGFGTGALAEVTESSAIVKEAVGAPIIRLPLSVVEPARNVDAAEWKSPYCGQWNDGCKECERESELSSPRCKSLITESASCERHAIICIKPISDRLFDRMCQNFFAETYLSYHKDAPKPLQPLPDPNKQDILPLDGDILILSQAFKVVWKSIRSIYSSLHYPMFGGYVSSEKYIIHKLWIRDVTEYTNMYLPEKANKGLRCWRSYLSDDTAAQDRLTLARLAGPPLTARPLASIELNREVEAEQWTSPYCLRWDDGCVECERDTSVESIPQCRPLKHSGTCKRRIITCGAVSMSSLAKACARYLVGSQILRSDGRGYIGGVAFRWIWLLDSDGEWRPIIEDRNYALKSMWLSPDVQTPGPDPRINTDMLALRNVGTTWKCIDSYTQDQDK